MILDADALYALLPAVYRERDAVLGVSGGPGPLADILGIIAGQLGLVDAEIDQLYDDAFIETCAAWVVPYIGDLIGYLSLSGTVPGAMSERAEVANTIEYRRWKGTATILEQLASDVTGWSAVAVEFFERLTTTQYVNHIRLGSPETVDVRHWQVASTVDTPFDQNSHLVEVRRIATGRGKYNIPNVGVYVWRLAVYDNRSAPSQAFAIDENRYTFDPTGIATEPIFNVPPLDRVPFTRTRPQDVPAPLARRVVADPATRPLYLGATPVFVVYDASGHPIPAAEVDICDLSGWTATPPALTGGYVVAVDPTLGRIWLPVGATTPLLVEYAYGFSGPYGAGFQQRPADPTPITAAISRDAVSLGPSTPLETAIGSAAAPGQTIAILYEDSVTDTTPVNLTVGDGETLVVRADDFRRPVLTQQFTLTIATDPGKTATVVLDGLLLAGGLVVEGTGSLALTLRNATVRPATATGTAIGWTGADGTLTLESTLCGSIALDPNVDAVISDTIVDAAGGAALVAGALTLARATVFGTISCREVVLIENSIVTATVTSARRQAGCVRYSYLTLDSLVPQRYRCQPDTAIRIALAAATVADPSMTAAQEAALSANIALGIVPRFTASDYGDPSYAQLSAVCAAEIAAGADDGGEMGVFHDLFTALRERNLGIRLSEYLRLGLEAGVLHA
jgi:hypothetical protein